MHLRVLSNTNPVPRDFEDTLGILGDSGIVELLRRRIRRVARTEATVLIRGETGTGKELVARAIHLLSPRRDRPFMAVNVATLSDALLLDELFGHGRGAYTGASNRRSGVIAAAHGGTLFLDEVGDLSPAAQGALLRVLETHKVRALGEDRERDVDVRVVVASAVDLRVSVTEEHFRRDLYYRLAQVPVDVPALRDRGADVVLLAEHFAPRLSPGVRREITKDAMRELRAFDWPGNVRELMGVMTRAGFEADDDPIDRQQVIDAIRACALPSFTRREESSQALRVVELCGGNVAEAARLIGVARSTLRDRLRRTGKEPYRTPTPDEPN